MSKELIVSVNGREKKIAILDNGKVTEFYIERGEENTGVAGNIYKGRVMRVLPGMQSAFVDIGLERDAFLYVSDFFDEEEEIERIVAEKSKKTSPEEAKREANEQIERSRVEREKQMESVQDLAEPLVAGQSEADDAQPSEARPEQKDRKRGRRGRGRDIDETPDDTSSDAANERPALVSEAVPAGEVAADLEFDTSGFERISDDADTGEMFKDAYIQEAIVDRVRAVEFDLEPAAETEVGSLLAEVDSGDGGFERIADEDETPAEAPAKGRKRKSPAAAKPKAEKPAKKAAAKTKTTRSKKAKPAEDGEAAPLEDAEASLRERDETAEMAVRRGGRGRRRGAKPKPKGLAEDIDEAAEFEDEIDAVVEASASEPEENAGEETAAEAEEAAPVAEEAADAETSADGLAPAEPEAASDDDKRERGGRSRRGRGRDRQNGDRNGRSDRRERTPQPVISDLLREGQEILVQIAKEPIAKKGARITSHIALPGRFLVYMPTIEHLGVSRKIESSSERGRLRTLIQRIRQEPEITSGGFIVRTAGIGISEEDLKNDALFLVRTWKDAKKNAEKRRSPSLIHQDLDLVQRLLRDQLSSDFTAIRVDSEEEYLATVEFLNRMAPKMVNRVKLYTRDEPILEYYGVQDEIDKALKPRVWLRSGGYLVINQTEALVAIDVNTGKFVGKGNARLEDTITKTNLEAVDEIARQIRLRDLGGIIVLDLIDMEDRRNRHKVSQALQEALSHDKSPTKVLSFNDFGLIIMTRKRVKQSLERTMCAPCEYCEGSGWVKSPTTVCYEILAEARRLSKQVEDVRITTLRVHPEVAKALRNGERNVMDEIEAHLGNVDLTSDKSIHQAQFDFAFI
ncbi:MAG: Rne/Rng family ribonuclease [Pyrinomonadaceae bacterium]|nr:Rne/Rng family ribonuclease [Pyrinomonadaceae bacterium]